MNVPRWMNGADLVAITATPQTTDSNGNLTPGSGASMVTVIDRVQLQGVKQLQDVRPVTRLQINEVDAGTGTALTLTELLQGNVASVLGAIYVGFSYVEVVFQQGREQWTCFFKVGNLQTGVVDHVRNTATLELRPCDVGGNQVTLTII